MRKTVMTLVALGFLCAPMLMLQGCTTGDKTTSNTEISNTTIDSGGGDVTINDVQVSDEGTYIYNEDGTVTFTTGDENNIEGVGTGDSDGDGIEDVEVGTFSTEYSQSECTAAGFFYCTIENVCLDQPAIGGTCTSN